MRGKPTLESLARELGVSRQTVSNALNAPHRVKSSTLQTVLDGIRTSGYRPHVAGRQLRTRRSMNLAMRLYPSADGINGSIHSRFLQALTDAAQRQGYRLTLFTADDDDRELEAIDELLSVADIDGFVLTSTHHSDQRAAWLLEHRVPFVSFGRPWSAAGDPSAAPHDWVDVDGGVGTGQATRFLLGQGHRRIGFLGWPRGSGVGDDRRSGWRRALASDPRREVGASLERLNVETEDSVVAGADGALELFGRGATAIVCASDSLALGAIAAWRNLTPQPAEGPPVMGFDDTPIASAIGLSSVRQPIEQTAGRVVDLLLARLDRPHDGVPQHVLLPSTLIARHPDPQMFTTPPRPE